MDAASMIRVLLVDDHALVREGLRRMLGTSGRIEVVGEAADGVEAMARVQTLRPDVVLLDVSMPRKNGIDTAAEIDALDLEIRTLILTMYSDAEYALRALRAGASGFLWKGAGLRELLDAVTTVAEGQSYVPRDLREQARLPIEPSSAELLTRRQLEVMRRLVQGMTNREIALELGISVRTVDTHRGQILKKLKVRNNSELTRFAIRSGLLA